MKGGKTDLPLPAGCRSGKASQWEAGHHPPEPPEVRRSALEGEANGGGYVAAELKPEYREPLGEPYLPLHLRIPPDHGHLWHFTTFLKAELWIGVT